MRTHLPVYYYGKRRGTPAARVSRRIWCVECVCDNAETLHRWVYRGLATACGGLLKVELCCSGCRKHMCAGTYAEAVTLHRAGVAFARWEGEVVALPDGRSGASHVESVLPAVSEEEGV